MTPYIRFGILLSTLSLLFLSSCTKTVEIEKKKKLLDFISLDEIKPYFPEEYQMGKNIVFVNETGQEWIFMPEYELTITTKRIGDHIYEAESINVSLYDHKNSGFQINLYASSGYSLDSILLKSLSCIIRAPLGIFFTNSLSFRDGTPEHLLGADFDPTVTWFSRTFEDVSQFRTGNQYAYSELHVNPIYGVISFRDELDFLWVFDRFE